jgi:ribosomal protein L16/L10AE
MKNRITTLRVKIPFLNKTTRPKAWAPLVYNFLTSSKSYFFKKRIGKRSKKKNYTSRVYKNYCFFVLAKEAALIKTSQVDVLWRTIRRYSRRFPLNFRRSSFITRIQLTGTKTINKRKKGGRMGSGKSPFEGCLAPICAGQTFFWLAELRFEGTLPFQRLRSAIKKKSAMCKLKYVL